MKATTFSKSLFAAAVIAATSSSAFAKDQPVTVGLGVSAGPDIWQDADRRVQPVPIVTFRKGNFYGVGGNYGYNLVQTNTFEIGINLNARFEGFDVDDADGVLEDFDDNDPALEAGIRAAYKTKKYGTIEGIFATDITDAHDGEAGKIRYSYRFGNKSVSLVPFVSFNYRSQEVVEYYYGISEDDLKNASCNSEEAAKGYCDLYAGDDTWSYSIGTAFNYRFAKNWSMVASAEFESYDSEIEDSPLVDDSSGLSGMIGVAYTF